MDKNQSKQHVKELLSNRKELENLAQLSDQSAQKLKEIFINLTKHRLFNFARRLMKEVYNIGKENYKKEKDVSRYLFANIIQHYSIHVYKDPDLPLSFRLEEAIKILKEAIDILPPLSAEPSSDKEKQAWRKAWERNCGIFGSIYKRKWDFQKRKDFLETSLFYYYKGYELGIELNDTYCGVNAAFIFDLLAQQENLGLQNSHLSSTSSEVKHSSKYREKAKIIREKIVELLSSPSVEKTYWVLATLAEAQIGLALVNEDPEARKTLYEKAKTCFEQAKKIIGQDSWKRETTAKQIANLIILLDEEGKYRQEVKECLKSFLGNEKLVESAFMGKVGLALSGGGFRASLFHIGVLARLAELGWLKHIEVLSCVSGGSILGAYYYLKLQKLLESKDDNQITDQDYIDLVQEITKDFLIGVQENIRTRIITNLKYNFKMLLGKSSRSERVAELYEELLYSKIFPKADGKPIYMDDLKVRLPGRENISPKDENGKRENKIPILILNATSLNTGHNWQFAATWMGEPPTNTNTSIDANYRLRRLYYDEAPENYKNYPLRDAVAASACVPGLLNPVKLESLYPDDNQFEDRAITVELVDGGVHDNQGISSLLEEECNVILVSDATGQMGTEDEPNNSALGTPLRSYSVLMARVREAQYLELEARKNSGQLRSLMYIHLRQDLDLGSIDWKDCNDPKKDLEANEKPSKDTSFGVGKDIQELISNIRTDLDSFNDKESYALMADGYLMTKKFANNITVLKANSTESKWCFDIISPLMSAESTNPKRNELVDILRVASMAAFKVWSLDPVLKAVKFPLILVGGLSFFSLLLYTSGWLTNILGWGYADLNYPLVTISGISKTLIIILATTLIYITISIAMGKSYVAKIITLEKLIKYKDTLTDFLMYLVLSFGGFILAWLHLKIFDSEYLKIGQVEKSEQKH